MVTSLNFDANMVCNQELGVLAFDDEALLYHNDHVFQYDGGAEYRPSAD